MHGPEALEGAGMLEELPGVLGLILWQSIRDVTLWAETLPSERSDLFSPGAERSRIATILSTSLDPELEQPLGLITAMVGQPARVSAERVALSCRRIAQWAENNGHLATALAFAQAGAITCPGNAAAAFKVGQIARRRAEYVRAETWFRRTIALGRQEGDWTSYALGFAGLGTLYSQRGSLPKAKAFHVRCLRAAKRHGMRSIQGGALHDLAGLAIQMGELEKVPEYAFAAFEAYGPSHANIPVLAQDIAYFWVKERSFDPAFRVFRALLPHVGKSIERLVLLPNLARAAGGLGEQSTFEWVWSSVWEELRTAADDAPWIAEACLELARGASNLGDWERAEVAAERALYLAQRRREARVEWEAEREMDSIRFESTTVQCNGFDVATQEFAGALVQSLEVYAASS